MGETQNGRAVALVESDDKRGKMGVGKTMGEGKPVLHGAGEADAV